jgi:hypothetical protein
MMKLIVAFRGYFANAPKHVCKYSVDYIKLALGKVESRGFCEHGNESSDPWNVRNFMNS